MRFRTHVITSVLTGIAIYPHSRRQAGLVALAGVLVDLDHYLLYGLRSGDWSLVGAWRYDRRRGRSPRRGDTRPRYGSLRSVLHQASLTLPALWLLSWRWAALRPIAIGVTLHLALDTDLPLRLDWRIWRRADRRCERCSVAGLELGVYHRRKPQTCSAYWSQDNRVVWCNTCAREMRRDMPM